MLFLFLWLFRILVPAWTEPSMGDPSRLLTSMGAEPVLFSVFHRAPTMMATVEMRGYPRESGLGELRPVDVAVPGVGLLILGLAILDRFLIMSPTALEP